MLNNNHMESTEPIFTTYSERAKEHQHGSSQVSRSKKASFSKPTPSTNEENREDCKLWHFKCNEAGQKELEKQLGKGIKWVIYHFFKHIRSRSSARESQVLSDAHGIKGDSEKTGPWHRSLTIFLHQCALWKNLGRFPCWSPPLWGTRWMCLNLMRLFMEQTDRWMVRNAKDHTASPQRSEQIQERNSWITNDRTQPLTWSCLDA